MLEFIILGTLFKCSDLTGYDIRKYIEEGIGMFYKASYGSIYPILNKLLQQGYVTCKGELEGKREKKKYVITDEGRKVFIEWLEEDLPKGSSMESFMAKVFFFDALPDKNAADKITAYELKLVAYKNELVEQSKQYETLKNKKDFYYKLSTLYFGICKLQSIIDWCDVVKQRKELEQLVQQEDIEEE